MSPLPARALVVSLHDVSPHTQAACGEILAALRALDVPQTSLLVIPDHHRRGPFFEDAEFCTWLTARAHEGHEIVTHGYFHQRSRRPGESVAQKLATRIYTADEGEFYDLDRATARELVARGNAELQRAGFSPHGFIAPAWLLSGEAADALRDLGVEYTTTLGAVTDLRTGQSWSSQSLVWSVRSGWRRGVSRAWNAALFRRLRRRPLLRVSIHPVDLAHPAIWNQIQALVMRARQDRQPMTYHAWIAQSSSFSSSSLPRATGKEKEMKKAKEIF